MAASAGILYDLRGIREKNGMTEMALTLELGQVQAEQLAGMCATYRTHAWRALEPTAERNQSMRAVQAVQGRISQARAAGGATVQVMLCAEERRVLRQMLRVLMQARGTESASEQRNQALGELAGLRMVLEQACRQAWAW